MKRFRRVLVISLVLGIGCVSAASGQELDQKAWNAVWDRFEGLLESGSSSEDIVHVLEFPVPATWVNHREEDLRQLQQVAGVVPGEVFSIDPALKDLRLHELYYSVVGDVSFPQADPNERRALEEATAEWNEAFDEYLQVLDRYMDRWDRRRVELEDMNEPVNSLARMRFRNQLAGMFVQVQQRLDSAAADIQRFSPVVRPWADAVRRLTTQVTGAKSDLVGLWTYEGDFAAAAAIGEDCEADGPGWEVLTFDRSVEAERIREGAWNGGGSFGGSFFSVGLGGKGTTYEKTLDTSSESISLRFCKLTYLNLGPGDWFDMSLLQAMEKGVIGVKEGSPNAGERILGPDGLIPRMVKGVIVARSVAMEADLAESKLQEMRKKVRGGGGIRIGPFRIGGGGSSSKYERDYETAQGHYGRSTTYEVPVVLAVVTEPTASLAPSDDAGMDTESEAARR